MNNEYVQYGCGYSAPDNWVNFDASPTLMFERTPVIGKFYTRNSSRFPDNIAFGDIVSGLPIPDNFCQGVYCSHVLEHLCLEDFRVALKNTFKILKNGGCFRLVLPDLEYSVKKYIDDKSNDKSLVFLRETYLGKEKRNRGFKGFVEEWLGNSQHLWMWDYSSISKELEDAGFVDIRRAMFGDSMDPMFQKVENQDRWIDCLGVECRKA
jgi:SAM-dependent methyltransferase